MVSKVKVEDTICGYTALVNGWQDEDGIFRADVKTECPHLRGFVNELKSIGVRMDELYRFMNNVYKCAKENKVPATCPVPTAITNAWWLEIGMISKQLAHHSVITIEIPKTGEDITKVRANTPLCDHITLVRARKTPEGKIKMSLATDCPIIKEARDELPEIDPEEFSEHSMKMYEFANEHNFTPTCFVPVAMAIACVIESGKLDKNALSESIKISYPE